jgi:outer membrane protein assembly factor BamD (BamD/ComL family)
MTKKTVSIICVLITVCSIGFITGCKSSDVVIPQDITEGELLQLGQDSLDKSDYDAAQQYYQGAIDIFGDNPSSRIIAQFEIAHIYIKQEKWELAKPLLENILSSYEDSELVKQLPAEYKKLAQIDLAKIPQ